MHPLALGHMLAILQLIERGRVVEQALFDLRRRTHGYRRKWYLIDVRRFLGERHEHREFLPLAPGVRNQVATNGQRHQTRNGPPDALRPVATFLAQIAQSMDGAAVAVVGEQLPDGLC